MGTFLFAPGVLYSFTTDGIFLSVSSWEFHLFTSDVDIFCQLLFVTDMEGFFQLKGEIRVAYWMILLYLQLI